MIDHAYATKSWLLAFSVGWQSWFLIFFFFFFFFGGSSYFTSRHQSMKFMKMVGSLSCFHLFSRYNDGNEVSINRTLCLERRLHIVCVQDTMFGA